MGDPKKQRKKFSTPSHPWQKARIEEESKLIREYGIKNKKEIWKMKSVLSDFATSAKRLATITRKQQELEKAQLLQKLQKMGLIKKTSQLTEILSLTVREILERRLQTMVHRKALSRSMKQARQFITHGHIMVNNKKITAPSYLVSVDEEEAISFVPNRPLASIDHPERTILEKKAEE